MSAPIIRRGKPDSGSPVHYVLTLQEHVATNGGRYVDPDRYREGHRDYSPEMLCGHGGFHAFGTRDEKAVTCDRCVISIDAEGR